MSTAACTACEQASTDPLCGSYFAPCKDCAARMLAHSPLAFNALKGAQVEKFQRAIQAVWPDDYEAGRRLVWNWMKRINAARAAPKGQV